MQTELLIIKCKNSYIRVKDDTYTVCGLDKASVYPVTDMETVSRHCRQLKDKGFDDIRIRKLIITEEALT
ncbi:MAG: hypothetical protein SWH61_10855 [Thermodesulfobacteriota bacterium]|nr:hypothetical protein [Thermodesulfobacteriota bacterium]